MARVITFSEFFPAYHPKKGEPTLFLERVMRSFSEIIPNYEIPIKVCKAGYDMYEFCHGQTKHHTIRAGKRWKVGDYFSPRIWSGKPYQSKQIVIGPDIQIKKIWDFQLFYGNEQVWINGKILHYRAHEIIAKNDGLELLDFVNWFVQAPPKKSVKLFEGQIICWNENINY